MYIKDEEIYTDRDYCISSEPSILFDRVTGTLHKYGSEKEVDAIFKEWIKKDTTGEVVKDLLMYTFERRNFTLEETVKELELAINNSGYCRSLFLHLSGEKN